MLVDPSIQLMISGIGLFLNGLNLQVAWGWGPLRTTSEVTPTMTYNENDTVSLSFSTSLYDESIAKFGIRFGPRVDHAS